MTAAPLKGLTLRGLEVFVSAARTGSVAATAAELGLSAPAVSQQLRNLSSALGAELLDHSRRPMTLTPAGRLFLERADSALELLRGAQRDLTTLDLEGLGALSLGVIEDFENEVTPALALRLAESMTQCAFRLQTGPSHILVDKLSERIVDIALCASPTLGDMAGILSIPLFDDPYILATPRGTDVTDGLESLSGLAFLRRDLDQVMGQQIEGYLGAVGIDLPRRFEMDSNQSITALVASGTGWTITTPLSLLRAGRFASEIEAHPLPGPRLARRISLHVRDDWAGPIPGQIATFSRDLIKTHFHGPALERMPWLRDSFRILA